MVYSFDALLSKKSDVLSKFVKGRGNVPTSTGAKGEVAVILVDHLAPLCLPVVADFVDPGKQWGQDEMDRRTQLLSAIMEFL